MKLIRTLFALFSFSCIGAKVFGQADNPQSFSLDLEKVQGMIALCGAGYSNDVKANLVGKINLWINEKISGNATVTVGTFLDRIEDDNLKVKAYELYLKCVSDYVNAYSGEIRYKKFLLEQFEQVLKEINVSLIRREEYMFPSLDRYIETPNRENWDYVIREAKRSIEQIERGVALAMEFDAKYATSGQEMMNQTQDTTGKVEMIFYREFKVAREVWNKKERKFERIVESEKREDLPDVEQVRRWQEELKEHYRLLRDELERLVGRIRTTT